MYIDLQVKHGLIQLMRQDARGDFIHMQIHVGIRTHMSKWHVDSREPCMSKQLTITVTNSNNKASVV